MLVILAPGQGSQSPGMLAPWLDLPGAGQAVERWSVRTGLDLRALGTTAPAEKVTDTRVAQPLLVAAALLSARALLTDSGPGASPDAVCGHSVGELAAAAVAGVLDDEDAVALAAERGAAMADAAALSPTGMSAVLGGDLVAVQAVADALGLTVATVNTTGQVVLAGPRDALDALTAAAPAGARVRPLQVAGGFHSPAMAPAVDRVAACVAALRPRPARCPVVANADGALLTDGAAILARLPRQLVGPVRFDLCLAALSDATEIVELAPGGTLAALARRALPGARVTALRTPADLPGVAA